MTQWIKKTIIHYLHWQHHSLSYYLLVVVVLKMWVVKLDLTLEFTVCGEYSQENFLAENIHKDIPGKNIRIAAGSGQWPI